MKDFGIIATEHGWNLYAGGNGGFIPRHADLLASDLDTTPVRTIDRFLAAGSTARSGTAALDTASAASSFERAGAAPQVAELVLHPGPFVT